MHYLIAVFIPPVYFLMKKRWLPAIVTSVLCFVSFFMFMTVVMAPIGFILWFGSSIVAVWDLRKQLMREHARMIAEEIAGTQRRCERPPELDPMSSKA